MQNGQISSFYKLSKMPGTESSTPRNAAVTLSGAYRASHQAKLQGLPEDLQRRKVSPGIELLISSLYLILRQCLILHNL